MVLFSAGSSCPQGFFLKDSICLRESVSVDWWVCTYHTHVQEEGFCVIADCSVWTDMEEFFTKHLTGTHTKNLYKASDIRQWWYCQTILLVNECYCFVLIIYGSINAACTVTISVSPDWVSVLGQIQAEPTQTHHISHIFTFTVNQTRNTWTHV